MAFLDTVSTSITLLYAIAAAAVLVYVPFLVVAYGRLQTGYDSAAPRALFDKLPDYAKRATWAHQNSFEAFTLFAPAALMAYVTQTEGSVIVGAAIAHVVARFFFSVFYVLNIPLGRSLMFVISTGTTATLIGLSLVHVQS